MNIKVLRQAGWLLLGVLAGGWLVAGCATAARRQAAPPPPEPCLRVLRADDGTLALQVAVRRLLPRSGRGPEIHLVGASHLGDANYFAQLQQRLDAAQLVLYEGVGGRPEKPVPGAPPPERASLQTSLAHALGLVFQLEAIDYDRPHFRNSDVSVEEIRQRLQATEAGGGELQNLLQIMDGSSFMGALLQAGVRLIGSSPRLQATFRVVFIETLGQLKGDLTRAAGLPPALRDLMTFIIHERNQIVLRDLRTALAARPAPRSIAIFYGAGHLHDLESRLTAELQYRPAGDEWLSAFSINTREAGLGEAELSMVRGLVNWQMNVLQRGPTADQKPETR